MSPEPNETVQQEPTGAVLRTGFLLLIILLFGTALRLHELVSASFWYDEAASVYLGRFYDAQCRFFDPGWNNEAPLYPLLVKLWGGLVSAFSNYPPLSIQRDYLFRLLPCVFGLLGIPLIYVLARRILEREESALLAALFFAISPFQIYYAQELRVYSLFVCLALAATWFLWRVIEDGKTRYWLGMVLTLALLMYSHFIAVWIIFTFNLFILLLLPFRRDLLWRWTAWMLLLMVLIAPALLMAWWMNEIILKIEGTWYPTPTWKTAAITFKNFFAGYSFTPWAYHGLLLSAAAFLLLGFLGLLRRPKALLLLGLLIAVPIGGNVLLWGLRSFSFYEHRLFIFSGAIAIIVVAYGVAMLRFSVLVGAAILLFSGLTWPCLQDLYAHRIHPLETHRLGVFDKVDYRRAAVHIGKEWTEGDFLAHDSLFTTYSMQYYLSVPQAHLDCGVDDADPNTTDAAIYVKYMANGTLLQRHNLLPVPAAEATKDAQRVWLLEPRGITFDNVPQSIPAREWLAAHGFALQDTRPFNGLEVLLYKRAAAPPAPAAVQPLQVSGSSDPSDRSYPSDPPEPSGTSRPSVPHQPPNVLIILIDALRADHLGLYGYSRNTSPFIDHLGAEGVVFEQAVSPSSYTRESVAALFTGRYPACDAWGMGWYATPDPALPGLGKLFQNAGYTTALFTATPMLEGLSFYEGFTESECVVLDFGDKGYSVSGQGPRLVKRMLQFADTVGEKPFLAYLHFLDPHAEYEPAREALEQFHPPLDPPVRLYNEVRFHVPELVAAGFGPGEARFDDLAARYDAEIAMIDENLRELFDGLATRGLLDNTLVVVTADHGEEFLEHGFVEHAWQLYWESLHVPLIFWMPQDPLQAAPTPASASDKSDRSDTAATFLNPARVPGLVSLVDVLPTLASFCGIALGSVTSDGQSLLKEEDGAWAPQVPEGRPVFSSLLIQERVLQHAVFRDGLAYLTATAPVTPEDLTATARQHRQLREAVENGQRPPVSIWAQPAQEALFDLRSDPTQHQNVLEQHPEQAAQCRADLEALRARCPLAPVDDAQKRHGVSPELQQQMDALGYLNAAGTENKKDTADAATAE
ncbi:MAG: sulfatase-like hydrolase/transferase [Candidatus Hydrogenedentes bacterium]|nr:sulfatase-like hydrolase/transferase [Candidatus Hydrogenedentota bacterium]